MQGGKLIIRFQNYCEIGEIEQGNVSISITSKPVHLVSGSIVNRTKLFGRNNKCYSNQPYLFLYIRNLKYAHLTSVFRQHNINLVSSTCHHKYKCILRTEKPVLNTSFQDFLCTNINNHLFCFEKYDNYVFKS